MKRDEWLFEYTAAKLAEAAAAQKAFRQQRFEFWKGEKDAVMEKIKSMGLSVHEDLSLGLMDKSYNTTLRSSGAQVMVDPTLQKDLNECIQKMRDHSDLISSYSGWEQVLRGNPEARVQLDHDDWMFFFGTR